MRIGIVGAGNMGAALGRAWAAAGHQVLFSFSRDAAKLERLAAETPGALSGSPAEAVAFGEALLLAVPFDSVDDALEAAGELPSVPLLTTVSPYAADFQGGSVELRSLDGEVSAAERIAARAPAARVVEAFNLAFADLVATGRTEFDGEWATVPLCGDDAEAKAVAATLVRDAGFEPLELGPLARARALEQLATAWVQVAAQGGLFPLAGLRLLRRPR